ncbi:DUF947-domain-containing protein [Auriscalpium vulgare]|uniref:DUF947-domain-containing protein n=1 Tax=Auriscalpium vulgare TaxID=40419 RepID=A0ACB8S9J3_9AGAM|nr:DUF947-domain-containing protein [Auriscalpium vulgare]
MLTHFIRAGLSSLPFGALRKAQRQLTRAGADDNDSRDEDSDAASHDADLDRGPSNAKGKEVEARPSRKQIAHRQNKHAPTEMSSKRPVSRHRTVVEVEKRVLRDPRFLALAGEFDAQRFRKQYGFIADLHQDELKTLRENLKRAKKLLASSPRETREERQREVTRLELTVKRAESSVNRDKREKVEQDALSRASKEEREKRQTGKGQFWLKDSEKKKLLLKARYEAVAAEGGKGAVKKAIEKKQKKLSQKETKSRPFPRAPRDASSSRSQEQSSKRPRTTDDGYAQRKRQKAA